MDGERDKGERSGRWQRREERKERERHRIHKHGAGVRRVYVDAIRKRLKNLPKSS